MSEQLLFDNSPASVLDKEERRRERHRESCRRYAEKHPDRVKAGRSRYAAAHREQIAEKNAKYDREHPERFKRKNAKLKARRLTDNEYREKMNADCRAYYKRNRQAMYARAYRYNYANRARVLVNAAKGRCKPRPTKPNGIPFDLDAHIHELQERIDKGVCELTGIALCLDKPPEGTHVRYNTPSLDRIVPSNGYVYSNVRIVAHMANCMLGDWGEQKAFEIVRSWILKNDQKEMENGPKY